MHYSFNRAIRVLLMTDGLILIAGAMLAPIYALFVEEIGGDLLSASLAFAVFAGVAGIVTLFSAKLSDRTKHSETIVSLGYLTIGVGFILYIFVDSMATLLVAQALIGFGEALYSPAYDSVFSKHLDKHKEGREWGAWEAMKYFTTAAGAIIGGIIVAKFGFTTIFVIMALLCLESAFYIHRLPKKLLEG